MAKSKSGAAQGNTEGVLLAPQTRAEEHFTRHEPGRRCLTGGSAHLPLAMSSAGMLCHVAQGLSPLGTNTDERREARWPHMPSRWPGASY